MHIIKSTVSLYLSLLKRHLRPILLFTLLFFIGIVAGYFAYVSNTAEINTALEEFGLFEQLEDLVGSMVKMNTLERIFFIFYHNLTISTFIILFGAVIVFYPAVMLFSNGGFIGLIVAMALQEMSVQQVLLMIFPHGIIEIPAIIIATTWGTLLGIRSFQVFIRFITRKPTKLARRFYQKNLQRNRIYLGSCCCLTFYISRNRSTLHWKYGWIVIKK